MQKKFFVWLWGLLLVPSNYDNQVSANLGQKNEPRSKVNLCSIKCPLYTVGERLGENRIFGFPQKYHVKTTQDSTQMTFGCQIWPRPLFWTSEVTRGRRGHPRSRSNLTSWGQGKSFEYHIWGSRRVEVTRAASSSLGWWGLGTWKILVLPDQVVLFRPWVGSPNF